MAMSLSLTSRVALGARPAVKATKSTRRAAIVARAEMSVDEPVVEAAVAAPPVSMKDSFLGAMSFGGWAPETINGRVAQIAFVAGLGALITGAGTKGRRYALPNARFLLTTAMPGEVVQGQAEDIKNEITQKIKMNDAVEDVISKVTGRQRELIKKDFRRDFYLNAEEVRKEEEKGERGREGVGGG